MPVKAMKSLLRPPFPSCATCGKTKVGMVRLENVSADRNQVGWFQISASFGNQAWSMVKLSIARKAIMFQVELNCLSAQMNIGAKIAELTKCKG
mmetsp:Transcript_70019/g.85927  ORF Transcript_70019/g.85927 Transcript_70019/m.85927 type:complete len:94 (+) Transcript_70019:293-574(+)